MIELAFYRGPGRIEDRVIRKVTRSCFSHVELVVGHHGPAGWCFSASPRDGGVRRKWIEFSASHWEFLPVPWAPMSALARVQGEIGRPYDLAGLIGSQLLNLRRHSPDRWFCSELCAHALGLPRPNSFAPGDLYAHVIWANRVCAGKAPEESHAIA